MSNSQNDVDFKLEDLLLPRRTPSSSRLTAEDIRIRCEARELQIYLQTASIPDPMLGMHPVEDRYNSLMDVMPEKILQNYARKHNALYGGVDVDGTSKKR